MKPLAFQLLLLASIAFGALTLFSSPFFAIASLACIAFALLSSNAFQKGEKTIARNQVIFSFLLIALMLASNVFLTTISQDFSGFALLVMLPLFAVGVLAAKKFLLASTVEAVVVAFDHGFAVVRVEPSMSHPFKGEVAIPMQQARRGARVRLAIKESLFSPPRLAYEGNRR